MKELKKLQNKIKKIQKEVHELRQFDTSILLGKRIRISRAYADWIKEHGEEIGLPFSEMVCYIKRPYGVIKSVRYDDFDDNFCFTVEVEGISSNQRIGLFDFDIVDEK